MGEEKIDEEEPQKMVKSLKATEVRGNSRGLDFDRLSKVERTEEIFNISIQCGN